MSLRYKESSFIENKNRKSGLLMSQVDEIKSHIKKERMHKNNYDFHGNEFKIKKVNDKC